MTSPCGCCADDSQHETRKHLLIGVRSSAVEDAHQDCLVTCKVYGIRRAFDGDVPTVVPNGYTLEQNSPNPFNPRTEIAFDLPRAGHATLRVYDLAGRLVRTLADADLPSGRHIFEWDGRNSAGRTVAAGTYLYRLRSADFTETRQMTLVK